MAVLARSLGLGPVDVVGHSLGGFGPGMVSLGTAVDREEFRAFQTGMREAFLAMTAPPETGDRTWRDAQVDAMCEAWIQFGLSPTSFKAEAWFWAVGRKPTA